MALPVLDVLALFGFLFCLAKTIYVIIRIINKEVTMKMSKLTQRLVISLVVGVSAFTGLATFSPVSTGPLGAQKAYASCNTNKYTVVAWPSVAGRSQPDRTSSIIYTASYGQTLYGLHGLAHIQGSDGKYYTVASKSSNGTTPSAYIPVESRTYDGCF